MVSITPRTDAPDDQIRAFCERWSIVRFELFGSVLRDDFGQDSDIDVLVTFAPEAEWPLDLVHMEDELRELFGRDVDLVERPAVETSPNYIRRRAMLHSAQQVYARQR